MHLARTICIVGVVLAAACSNGIDPSAGPARPATSAEEPGTTAVVGSVPSSSGAVASYRQGSCPSAGCEVRTVGDLAYADDALVDVYVPVQPGPWPVVVNAHGRGGGKSANAPLAKAIAERGAVVYNVDLPDDPPFVDTVEHVACAVRFARSTAPDHDGNGGKVTVVGFSMGAYTGLLVGLAGDDHHLDGCAVDAGSGVADAVVGYEGPYDHVLDERYPFDLAALEESDPALWEALNPYAQLGRHRELVVRLIQGVDDDPSPFDVHPEVAEDLASAMADAGYDVALELVPGAPHSIGFPGLPQWDAIVDTAIETARARSAHADPSPRLATGGANSSLPSSE